MSSPDFCSLSGKTALVTGSSKGIGAAIALELARRGADVAVNYSSSADAAEAVVKDITALGRKSIALKADVSSPAEINKLFSDAISHFGKLDIVVSNAGKEGFKHVSQITEEDYDDIFGINCRTQLFVAKETYNNVENGGRLVLMSSISVQAKGVKDHSLYAGAKAAVDCFARNLANDFGDKKITVNAIAPGPMKTEMLGEVGRKYIPDGAGDNFSQEDLEQAFAGASPLKRLGDPRDVANVVALLVSKEGEWINGQTITIGGAANI